MPVFQVWPSPWLLFLNLARIKKSGCPWCKQINFKLSICPDNSTPANDDRGNQDWTFRRHDIAEMEGFSQHALVVLIHGFVRHVFYYHILEVEHSAASHAELNLMFVFAPRSPAPLAYITWIQSIDPQIWLSYAPQLYTHHFGMVTFR